MGEGEGGGPRKICCRKEELGRHDGEERNPLESLVLDRLLVLPMDSPPQPKRTYHVFLSFRGPDVRDNILSHLYKALDRRGIYTYIDSEEIRKGERISDALTKAIEESRIALILFSKDYASSAWCLDEVVKIMKCKETDDLIVLPVFFKVEPREVRGGRDSYKKAFDRHEEKYGKDSGDVKRWKKALEDAGNLSGWEFNDG